MTTHECVLCKDSYEGYGNNAQPLADGQCCNPCNDDVIIARLDQIRGGEDVTSN